MMESREAADEREASTFAFLEEEEASDKMSTRGTTRFGAERPK